MTFGQLKFRLLKQFPGLDLDVLEGFISDRYSEILHELNWSRLDKMAVLETVAPYATGTVTVTGGSNAIAGDGTAWTAAMTGRRFRRAADDAIYTFTFVSAVSGTLDRNYEGDTAAGASYSIFQNVYALPSDCRMLEDDAFSASDLGPLTRLSRAQLNLSAPTRSETGTPMVWCSSMDDSSTPPNIQVELYPIPDAAIGIPYSYTAELTAPGTGSAAYAPWMEPATALVEGVTAKIYRTPQFKDLAAAQLAAVEARAALGTMRNQEAQRLPHTQMQLPDHFISHRYKRWQS